MSNDSSLYFGLSSVRASLRVVGGGFDAAGASVMFWPVAVFRQWQDLHFGWWQFLACRLRLRQFVASSRARANMALKADWPDTAQFIV
jgi:hypothetical protein